MPAPWLADLNPAQRDAVTHGDGPLLVVAGAGTGKTKTLACRVAWLIEQGVSAERILLLTFTRRAAAEMLRRADGMIGQGAAAKVWGGTFHAVANRLLRVYGRAIGLSGDFTVMDEEDSADLINLVRTELGVAKADRRFPKKDTLRSIYSRVVNAREKLTQTLEHHFPWCRADAEAIRPIFDLYTQRKRERNVLDYDDLLLFWHALATAPGAGDAVADRFEHILVDEYQDTNAVQSEILIAMRRRRPNIMVVGDDAQSIYSFRAATVRNILDFPAALPDTRMVTLEQNYRSTTPILAASNAVMAEAKERYTKNLWSSRMSETKPLLFTCLDETEQCDVVCRHIVSHLEQGTALQRQAVLFRTGWHSDQLEVELSRRNIPFVKYGGLKFIEAAHVKDMLAFLRVLENPYDEMSWFRILLVLEGIGPKTAARLLDDLGVRRPRTVEDGSGNGSTIMSPLRRFVESPPNIPTAARKPFDALREALADCCGETPLAAQVARIRRFYEPIFMRMYDNAVVCLRDIEQLEHIAAGYRSRERFITDLTLDPPQSTADLAGPPYLDEDYLILSTIHSAKGCEWDVVHIIHAADGMLPSDMSLSDEAGVEEERRLLYVAMTRAKDMLYLYFPLRYYHRRSPMGDAHSYAQLSRYLTESVRRLMEERATTNGEVLDAASASVSGVQRVDARIAELWRD